MKDEARLIGGDDVSPRTVPEPHAISHRRKIGAFYTPLTVATILCNWGIRTNDDTVLEPCFGGCTFLEALLTRLQLLGKSSPENQLFGCDIDPLAFKYLENFGNISQQRANFILKDFLSVGDIDIAEKFDLIIGNPPYIRHSKFDILQKATVAAWAEKYDIALHGRASLWAYFILHALNFLKLGGRVAWVLPVSFLTSAYSTKVREILGGHFSRISAITLTERLFLVEGTEEATVILLAEGFGDRHEPTQISIECVDTIAQMKALVEKWPETCSDSVNPTLTQQGSGMLPIEAIISFNSFTSKNLIFLKDLAAIQIGLVTGNVPYFIKPQKKWDSLGISSKYLRYIVPKTKWIHGISINIEDKLSHIENGIPCLALDCPVAPQSAPVKEYLAGYDKSEILLNATFRKRGVWHYFFDDRIPDAFMVFMTHLGPRMIINNVQANCTNSVYRVFFKSKSSNASKKLAAISLNTTYSQFSAELLGQGRGSGALKLEPSHTLSLRLYIPPNKSVDETNAVFTEIDGLLRSGEFDQARIKADTFIFSDEKDFIEILPIIKNGLNIGRKRRMRSAEQPT
ncbi:MULTISPECIES: Eco57I restriction-modification methylase domain-containing protein [unclassified Janthinobacterium]|uniref:Eco57I restriction-modification methylase domain-containing protein n=1 Tax=unclassified Janthinobacterium TaxID=2610881 RepID=UPI000344A866|nr:MULTISPECIES: N-6 DNA methylase [unclassified Janthinobacterium]MEC5162752.1 adenine-specific DNA-methyltransferase [Janthinobacterium sp. CG_S6]